MKTEKKVKVLARKLGFPERRVQELGNSGDKMMLSIRECANIVGLSASAMRERIRKGSGPYAIKLGNSMTSPIRVPLHGLLEWMSSFEVVCGA